VLWEAVPDRIAAVDPTSWRVAIPAVVLLAVAVAPLPQHARRAAFLPIVWWLAFLLPVLPLAHHNYLYYLYVPWIGGAIAGAVIGRALLERLGPRARMLPGLASVAAFVFLQARNVQTRATATRDALPVDPIVRGAMLLHNSIPVLQAAHFMPGTRIGFVNPVPRARVDLITGAPTRPEDLTSRHSYFPLEAAMRGGETLRLFVPNVVYLGFAATIPRAWENAECFYYEQRGWLQPWGRGQQALMRQAEVQTTAGSWAAAESSFLRVRALGDTIPGAVLGQARTLAQRGRTAEATLIANEFIRRWPKHPLRPKLEALVAPTINPNSTHSP